MCQVGGRVVTKRKKLFKSFVNREIEVLVQVVWEYWYITVEEGCMIKPLMQIAKAIRLS